MKLRTMDVPARGLAGRMACCCMLAVLALAPVPAWAADVEADADAAVVADGGREGSAPAGEGAADGADSASDVQEADVAGDIAEAGVLDGTEAVEGDVSGEFDAVGPESSDMPADAGEVGQGASSEGAGDAVAATGISLSCGQTLPYGETVVVSPTFSGSVQPGDFAFNYVWCYEDAWERWGSTLTATGSRTEDLSWEFTPELPGTYVLYIDVTHDGLTETFSTSFEVVAAWEAVSFDLSSDRIALGQSVDASVSFAAGSNTTGLTYNYVWQRDDWSVWGSSLLSGSAESAPTHMFTPDALGVYTLYVDVVDALGNTVTLERSLVVEEAGFGLSISDDAIVLEEPCTVTADVPGDSAGYCYNFGWQLDGSWDDGCWSSTLLETDGYTTDPVWEFTPTAAGSYRIFADIVSPDGTVRTLTRQVAVGRGWEVSGIWVSGSEGRAKVSSPLSFGATVTGSRSDRLVYNYVWQRDGWEDWGSTLLATDDYTAESSADVVLDHSGSYLFAVDIVDTYSGEVVTLTSDEVAVDRAWSATGLRVEYDGLLVPGSTVTLAPVVSGDIDGLSYNYVWECDDWSTWWSNRKDGREDVAAPVVSCALGSGNGWYRFYVDITDHNGETVTVASDAYRVDGSADALDRVTSLALSQLGVEDGTAYEDAVLNVGGRLCYGTRGYWCGAYLWWAFDRAGASYAFAGGEVLAEPRAIAQWYEERGSYSQEMRGVQPGDLVFFDWEGWGFPTHVALCIAADDAGFTVVEGNTPNCATNWFSYDGWSNFGYARTGLGQG